MEPNRKVRKQGLEHFIKFVRELPSPSPQAMFQALEDQGYRGQTAARRALCLMAYRHIKRIKRIYIDGVDRSELPRKSNFLCVGPTGSGKTFLVETLFGKILNLPVSTLLGGRFRESIPMYSHGIGLDMLDKASCRAWAERIRQLPEGFTVYKNNIHEILHVPSGVYANTLTTAQLRDVRIGYENVREAVGDDIDIAVHCHGELDTPSAISVASSQTDNFFIFGFLTFGVLTANRQGIRSFCPGEIRLGSLRMSRLASKILG